MSSEQSENVAPEAPEVIASQPVHTEPAAEAAAPESESARTQPVAAAEPEVTAAEPDRPAAHPETIVRPVITAAGAFDPHADERAVRHRMAQKTRRSFIIGGAAAAAGYAGYHWIARSPAVGQLQEPLRKAMEFNREVSVAVFRHGGLSATYPASRAVNMRLNGSFGQDPTMLLKSWRLQVVGLKNPEQYRQYIEDVDLWTYETGATNASEDQPEPPSAKEASPKQAPTPATASGVPLAMTPAPDVKAARPAADSDADETPIPKAPAGDTTRTPGIVLSLRDIRSMPSYEQVVQFKCIEGWSQITGFRGARFSDFVKAFPPAPGPDGAPPKYVMMETSDGIYTCGFDLQSLMHPQTLLCYEMHNRPLTMGHGAPLRLAMPTKYGYKQIKQVAKITYTNTRAVDYWENLGYDWYAGL